MRYVKRYERHSIRETPKRITYHLRVVDQPLRDRVAYILYHWYDMRIPVKIPGWRRVEAWAENRGGEVYCVKLPGAADRRRTIVDWIVNWSIAQDLRCYELSERNVTTVAEMEVSKEVYEKKESRWRAFKS